MGAEVHGVSAPVDPPQIETLKDARAIGRALNIVLHHDADWAERVFVSDPHISFRVGPGVLNQELYSMWHYLLTESERLALLKEFTIARME